MYPLLVLHTHHALRAHLARAAPPHYEVHEVATWSALRAALREVSPTAIVIVDPYAEAGGGGPSEALRILLRDFDYVPVVAALETRNRFRDLLILARWGISDVISLDQEAIPVAVAQRLRAVRGRALQTALERSAPKELAGRTLSLLLTAADIASSGGKADDMARELGVSRRTVSRWCARARLPPPRRLLAWMRLLLASAFLDDSSRKIFQIAHACGYSSDNALRTAFDLFLARSPKELRRVGAFATVSLAFWTEVRHLQALPTAS